MRGAGERRLPIARVDMAAPPGRGVAIDDVRARARSRARARARPPADRDPRRPPRRGRRPRARGRSGARRSDVPGRRAGGSRCHDDSPRPGSTLAAVGTTPPATPSPTAARPRSSCSRPTAPTAIVCHHRPARARRDRDPARAPYLPGDLSVTGFDDLPEAALASPPLTTVQQDHEEKGAAAARLLLEGDAPSEPVVLPTRLVTRGST